MKKIKMIRMKIRKKEKQDKEFVDLIAQMKVVLGEQVKDIRLSSKLTDSPVCLVADDGDMDIAMEQLMAQNLTRLSPKDFRNPFGRTTL